MHTNFLRQTFPRYARTPLYGACAALLLLISIASGAHGAGVWTKQKSNTLAWLHAVYFVDAQKGWAAGGNGALLTTDDGGMMWRTLHRPTEDTLRDIYFSDAQNGWLVCERSIFLLKTEDEPRSYLLRTTDGGATWRRLNIAGANPSERFVRIAFTEQGTRGWAFGEAGALFATRDGGLTWFRQLAPTRRLLLGGAFLDANTGWIVGAGSTILRTSDSGDTWNAANLSDTPRERLNAVSFVDAARGWAVGASGRILSTINGGRTWRTQTSNTTTDLYDVKFADQAEGWAVGADGVVLHTTTGGASWTIEQSTTTHPLERLFLAGRTRGWAIGLGGTIIAFGIPDGTSPKTVPQLKPGAAR
ncbi:MAG: WD40/YVTN/BNR-like repeat-containing protein [Pyrinomonadaceae bacterium]